MNSISVFWEKGGDDVYLLYGQGFGQTTTAPTTVPRTGAPGSIRWYQLNLGLFIDGGGFDRYLQVPEELPFTGDINELHPSRCVAMVQCGNAVTTLMHLMHTALALMRSDVQP